MRPTLLLVITVNSGPKTKQKTKSNLTGERPKKADSEGFESFSLRAAPGWHQGIDQVQVISSQNPRTEFRETIAAGK